MECWNQSYLTETQKFTSKFWKELHRLMGTKLLMSTSFHPQTDGAMEWANRSIGQVMRALDRNSQNDWAEHCPMVEFTLNSSVSASTGYAPFELNYGTSRSWDNASMPTRNLSAYASSRNRCCGT